jgi:predicted RNase H-like HicB family nuclease
MQYLAVIEKTRRNFSAYLPDIPGCVATGKTKEEVKQTLAKALLMHFKGLEEDGEPIPKPIAYADYVEAS